MKKEQQREELSKALGNIDDKFLTEDFTSMTKKKKISRTLLIMAATIGVLTAGTYYTGLLPQVVDQFSSIWGGNSRQIEMIQHIGYPVEASATSNGITISADAVMGDEHTATVIFSIGNEDGTPFLLPDGVDLEHFTLNSGKYFATGTTFNNSQSASGSSYFRDFDPDDGTIQYVEIISSEGKIPKDTVSTAYFGEIGFWNQDYTEKTSITEGDWVFDFRFKYKDISENFSKNVDIVWENETLNVENVSVSPFSVRVDLKIHQDVKGDVNWDRELQIEKVKLEEQIAELEEHESEALEQLVKKLEYVSDTLRHDDKIEFRVPFYATLSDGTVINFEFESGFSSKKSNQTSYTTSITYMFEEMIDMEEIQSITYGDYTVEVRQ